MKKNLPLSVFRFAPQCFSICPSVFFDLPLSVFQFVPKCFKFSSSVFFLPHSTLVILEQDKSKERCCKLLNINVK